MDKVRSIKYAIFLIVITFSVDLFAEPTITQSDHVWLIGDSNAFLLMQELPKLAKSDNIRFSGSPVPGSSVIQWTKLNSEFVKINIFKPTVILVCLGANDAYMGSRIIRNEPPFLNDLLNKLSRDNRKIIWIGPPKLEKAVTGLEDFYQMVSPRVLYLDSRTIDIDMWDDKLHPSFSGRKKWASWIWEKLTR